MLNKTIIGVLATLLLLTACTDYVQQMDDDFKAWELAQLSSATAYSYNQTYYSSAGGWYTYSSSSRNNVVWNNSSSSAKWIFSSSSGIVSLGSCKPSVSPINKGESTTWMFVRNSGSDIPASKYLSATFYWTFEGGSIVEDDTKFTSSEVTYLNAGIKSASVVVTLEDGSSEVINCSPSLRVLNSDGISSSSSISNESKDTCEIWNDSETFFRINIVDPDIGTDNYVLMYEEGVSSYFEDMNFVEGLSRSEINEECEEKTAFWQEEIKKDLVEVSCSDKGIAVKIPNAGTDKSVFQNMVSNLRTWCDDINKDD